MHGEMPYGKCEICGKESALHITYIRFPHIDCMCHGPHHFERYEVCKECSERPIQSDIRPRWIVLKENNLFDGDVEHHKIIADPEVLDAIERVLSSRLPNFKLTTVSQYNLCQDSWQKNQNEEELYIILSRIQKGEIK